ncbi:hypothetical protein KAR02_06200, partial [Candidatus Bipolaricaulota bacterium]|nr:hypothetical protein [Candidatus Bipolaricaulota bacterium]
RGVYGAWQSDDAVVRGDELGRNDLAPAAWRIYPELKSIGYSMSKLGGLYSGMTGSGSAFFTAFSNETEAIPAFEKLTRQEPNSRVYYCQPTRSGFAEFADTGFKEPSGSGHAEPR